MKKIYFTIACVAALLLSFECRAQEVKGCVCDTVYTPISDVNILFFQKDSLVAGIMTDKNGCFSLKLDTVAYTLSAVRLGYREYKTEVKVSPGNYTLPTIVLQEDYLHLPEVTISGEQSYYEAVDNKSIFKIPNNVKKAAVDAYQVLTHIPSLTVHPIEKTIDISGAGNHIVMVNNIRRNDKFLMTLNPQDIDRVEIIRDVSSRYQNIGAIVNIVVKKPVNGYSANINSQLNPLLRYGLGNGGYTFVADKLSISAFGQGFFFNEKGEKTSIVRDIYDGEKQIHTEKRNNNDGSFKMISSYLSANIDYILSPSSFILLSGSYVYSPQKSNKPYSGSRTVDDGEASEFDIQERNESHFNTTNLGVYYENKYRKNSQVNADLSFSQEATESDIFYKEWKLDNLLYLNEQNSDNSRKTVSGQLNFQHKIRKATIEEGYRLYWTDNFYESKLVDVINTEKHNEWRHYFYVNVLGKISDKFSYQAGSGVNLLKRTLKNNFSDTQTELTPNAMLRYFISPSQNVTFNYKLSQRSPVFSLLNPTPRYVDSTRVIVGNPDLSPYTIHQFSLRHELSVKKFYINSTIQYSTSSDYVAQKEYQEGGVHYITYANTSDYSNIGLLLNISYKPFNWWTIKVNADLNYYMYERNSPDQLHKDIWDPSIWLMSMINYKKFSTQLFYPFNFRKKTLFGYERYTIESYLNTSYKINNSWSVTAGIRYLNPLKHNRETLSESYTEIYKNEKTSRYFRVLLGFQYNLNKGKQKQYKQAGTKQYDDESTIDTLVY